MIDVSIEMELNNDYDVRHAYGVKPSKVHEDSSGIILE